MVVLAVGASRMLACAEPSNAPIADLDDASLRVASGPSPTPGFDGGLGFGVWQSLGVTPFNGYAQAIAYDAVHQKVVAYVIADAGQQTWLFDGTTWTNTNATAPAFDTPGADVELAMAFDAVRNKVVLSGTSAGAFATALWDGAAWTSACGFGGATPSCNVTLQAGGSIVGMTFDGTRKVTMLLDVGSDDVTLSLWAWTGSNWDAVCGAGSAPACAGYDQFGHGTAFVYDGTSAKNFWFGSTAGMSDDGDLAVASFEGSTWNETCPDCADGGGLGSFLYGAYDDSRDRVVVVADDSRLVAGGGGRRSLHTLDWDGTSLGQECSLATCEPSLIVSSSESAMTFDSARFRATFLTHDDSSGSPSTTYLYHVRGQGCVGDGDCYSEAPRCVDGVCADQLCGACEIATDLRAIGGCTQVPNGASTPRCHGTCNNAGVCILSNGATCLAGTDCSSDNCVDGVCCDGPCNGGGCNVCSIASGAAKDGVCAIAKKGTTCGAYLCDGSKVACPTTCATDADCAPGNLCESGACVATIGCVDDHTARLSDGSSQSCGAYKCVGSACASPCASINDCEAPDVCNGSGACVPPDGASNSGCSSTPDRSRGSLSFSLLMLSAFGIAMARRKKQKARQP